MENSEALKYFTRRWQIACWRQWW